MSKTESEFCMDLWRDMCGLDPTEKRIIPPLEDLKQTEWDPQFEQMMRNRLIMGAIRYETFAEKKYQKYAYAEEGIKKIAAYLITGNMEFLVDAGNYCLLEFKFGQRNNRHLQIMDDSEHASYLGKIGK